jgi:low affinity Fe/Cu permease
MEITTTHRRISRGLHWVGDTTSRAGVAATVAVLVIGFMIGLAFASFPGRWETGFSTVAAAITLIMVFAIQHTQSRQQKVTQLKLDELIRAAPRADDLLVHIEAADDEELVERELDQLEHHSAVRET